MNREVGITEGVEFDDYQSVDAVTGGFLFTMLEQSPAHAVAEKAEPGISPATATFGSAFHTSILEPDELEKRYVPKPEGMSFATTAGKLWRVQQTKEIIPEADWDAVRGMRDAVYAHPLAGAIMRRPALKEVSVVWQEQTPYGTSIGSLPIWCKGRPDFIAEDVLVDLKSTLDARPHAFNRQCDSLGYWLKMAHYQNGIEAAGHNRPREIFLIAAEKTKPHAVNVFIIPTETLNAARCYRDAALYKYRECRDSGVWPAYDESVYPITLSPWRISKIYEGS